jgi:hypothetical protein
MCEWRVGGCEVMWVNEWRLNFMKIHILKIPHALQKRKQKVERGVRCVCVSVCARECARMEKYKDIMYRKSLIKNNSQQHREYRKR